MNWSCVSLCETVWMKSPWLINCFWTPNEQNKQEAEKEVFLQNLCWLRCDLCTFCGVATHGRWVAGFRSQASNCNIASWIQKVLAGWIENAYPSNIYIMSDIRTEFSHVVRVYWQTFHASQCACLLGFFLTCVAYVYILVVVVFGFLVVWQFLLCVSFVCFVLVLFVWFCFVLFCFVLVLFVWFCFVLFWFDLVLFVWFCFNLFRLVLFRFVVCFFSVCSFCFVLFCFVSFGFVVCSFCFVSFCCLFFLFCFVWFGLFVWLFVLFWNVG